jgi:sterol desaturase/sphingolipid hydroxylase (fatty acid hydroxylase superfamily)
MKKHTANPALLLRKCGTFLSLFLRRSVDYLGYILAMIAGARNVTALVIVIIAVGTTLFFANKRRTIDRGRPSAGVQSPVLDKIYFFFAQLLIVFVAYLLGYFATSAGGELFGMWIQQEVLRIPQSSD